MARKNCPNCENEWDETTCWQCGYSNRVGPGPKNPGVNRRKIAPKDVAQMTPKEMRREIMRLRRAFLSEVEHTGNQRCWATLLQPLLGKQIDLLTLPKEVFRKFCDRYYSRNAHKRAGHKEVICIPCFFSLLEGKHLPGCVLEK